MALAAESQYICLSASSGQQERGQGQNAVRQAVRQRFMLMFKVSGIGLQAIA